CPALGRTPLQLQNHGQHSRQPGVWRVFPGADGSHPRQRMITVHNLHKAYGAKTVLSGVSAQFPAQRVTSLIGPNGAGKTTLLMMIARLLEPTQGDILIEGRRVSEVRISEYAKHVATLRQSPDFNLRLTVEELVAFGRFPYSRGALTSEDHRA